MTTEVLVDRQTYGSGVVWAVTMSRGLLGGNGETERGGSQAG